ncbi:MAG: AAA family ATPase [Candidatus Tectomicrobia bacterium]|uniref:AAA family ATPase n=1 Tax=Tectimicrobiota bacterium TaxID=2528274 RepID=A0A932GNE4_UNCTE|nr:AAA family ATPase [Candidatus Tectomicrobia bacterium]
MYKAFFGFKEQPFNISPDPRFLFLSRTHEDAFNQVVYGIRQRLGFIRVVGEVGTGKTILCRHLLSKLADEAATAYIFNPFLSQIELLRAINQDFGLPVAGGESEKQLVEDLNGFLMARQAAGRNAVLILDEAQNLEDKVLEQIRLLSNLETEREKLLQIVLVGQPELEAKLEKVHLRQLDQRIAIRVHLQTLNLEETERYIAHRLSIAGGRGNFQFLPEAFREIFRHTQGVPRKINLLCDRILLLSLVRETRSIDARAVEASAKDLGWRQPSLSGVQFPRFRTPAVLRWGRAAAVLIFLVGAAVLGHEIAGKMDFLGKAVGKLRGEAVTATVSAKAATPGKAEVADADREWRLQRLWSIREQLRLAVLKGGQHLSTAELADQYRMKSMTVTLTDSPPQAIAEPVLMQGWAQGTDRPELWVVSRASGAMLEVYDGQTKELKIEEPHLVPGKPVTLFLFYESRPGEDRILVAGDSGPEIEWLQRQLKELGYYRGAINGLFDEETRAAVKQVQSQHGLDSDGIAGPQTQILLTHLAGRPEKSKG